MKIEKQREITNKVLRAINSDIDPEACVCGGAPRNWVVDNAPARDIDLYLRSLHNTSKTRQEQLESVLSKQFVDFRKVKVANCEHYESSMNIIAVMNYEIEGLLFQFIYISPTTLILENYIMSHFDIGLCRISYRKNTFGAYELYYTLDFYKDFNNKTLTVFTKSQTDTQLRYCIERHLPKMMRYYPEYKFKICTVR